MKWLPNFLRKEHYRTAMLAVVVLFLLIMLLTPARKRWFDWFLRYGGKRTRVVLEVPKSEGSDEKIVRLADLTVRRGAPANILVCHGYMTNRTDISVLRFAFPYYNVMAFDFRGHGDLPESAPCTLGRDEALDIAAAAKFLRTHSKTRGKPVIGYGFSMGAVALIEAQARDPSLFDALILDCPFDSTEKIIERGLGQCKFDLFGYTFSIPGAGYLKENAFNPRVQSVLKTVLRVVANMDATQVDTMVVPVSPIESIKSIDVPCYFVHCKRDDSVPLEAVTAIYENKTKGYKRLWISNGRKHWDSFLYNPEGYVRRVNAFIDRIVSGAYKRKKQDKIKIDADELPVDLSAISPGEIKIEYAEPMRVSSAGGDGQQIQIQLDEEGNLKRREKGASSGEASKTNKGGDNNEQNKGNDTNDK